MISLVSPLFVLLCTLCLLSCMTDPNSNEFRVLERLLHELHRDVERLRAYTPGTQIEEVCSPA